MCDYIKDDLASGGRTYFIFPRIESKSAQNLKTVKSEHPKYVDSGVLGQDVSIEMIHGQLSAAEQNERAKRFKAGTTQVLFATSLVEVCLTSVTASLLPRRSLKRLCFQASNMSVCWLLSLSRSATTEILQHQAAKADHQTSRESDYKSNKPLGWSFLKCKLS